MYIQYPKGLKMTKPIQPQDGLDKAVYELEIATEVSFFKILLLFIFVITVVTIVIYLGIAFIAYDLKWITIISTASPMARAVSLAIYLILVIGIICAVFDAETSTYDPSPNSDRERK